MNKRLAPIQEALCPENVNGLHGVCLRLLPGETSEQKILESHAIWLEEEIRSEQQLGLDSFCNIRSNGNVLMYGGKFSPSLLMKIRERPEVDYVIVDEAIGYREYYRPEDS